MTCLRCGASVEGINGFCNKCRSRFEKLSAANWFGKAAFLVREKVTQRLNQKHNSIVEQCAQSAWGTRYANGDEQWTEAVENAVRAIRELKR